MKANPAQPILQRLVGLGSAFDAASFEEVRMCLEAGAVPAVISFGNTIKKVSAIQGAFAAGVTMFAFDSAEELEKLAKPMHPAAGSIAACWWRTRGLTGRSRASSAPRSRSARDLMIRAGQLGLDPYGLSFHVGSQQMDTAAYEAAIGQVGMLFTDLRDAGGEPAHG